VRRQSFSAATLNDAIAPLLRGRVTEYRFRTYNPGKTSNSWQISGERALFQSKILRYRTGDVTGAFEKRGVRVRHTRDDERK
jgi:hypothetical protein